MKLTVYEKAYNSLIAMAPFLQYDAPPNRSACIGWCLDVVSYDDTGRPAHVALSRLDGDREGFEVMLCHEIAFAVPMQRRVNVPDADPRIDVVTRGDRMSPIILGELSELLTARLDALRSAGQQFRGL